METRRVTITPAMAAEWLEGNTNNRNLSEQTVNLYTRAMLNGEWRTTHQGIALYEDCTVADGQHRLHAIVKSDTIQSMLVTFGVQREDAYGIDAHRPRSNLDIVRIGGEANWITSKMIPTLSTIYGTKKVSASEVIQLCEPIRDSLVFTDNLFVKHVKGISAVVRAAVTLAHCHGADEYRLRQFVEVLNSGVVMGQQDFAALKLRDYLLTNPSRGGSSLNEERLNKTQNALIKFLRFEPMRALKQVDKLPFPQLNAGDILMPAQ